MDLDPGVAAKAGNCDNLERETSWVLLHQVVLVLGVLGKMMSSDPVKM